MTVEPVGEPIVTLECKRIVVALGRDGDGRPWMRESVGGDVVNSELLDEGFVRAWGSRAVEAVGGELPRAAATVEMRDARGRTRQVPSTGRLWLAAAPRRRPVHVVYRDDAGEVVHSEVLLARASPRLALRSLMLRLRSARARGRYTYRGGR